MAHLQQPPVAEQSEQHTGGRAIQREAKNVLQCRSKYEKSTLADLYDPLAMPEDPTEAHLALDRAVDEKAREISPLGLLARALAGAAKNMFNEGVATHSSHGLLRNRAHGG
ncbi:MAG: type IIL restriction-modification enzyme MmeI [Pseudomonadota bacterium]